MNHGNRVSVLLYGTSFEEATGLGTVASFRCFWYMISFASLNILQFANRVPSTAATTHWKSEVCHVYF